MSARRHRDPGARGVGGALVLLALAAAGMLAGCGLGAGATPAGVHLDVTRSFGSQVIRSLRNAQAHGQETVMSVLMRNTTVSTRYGGGFVESIDGYSGGYQAGQPIDWFYYVNGVLAPEGGAETNVRAGDRIWWDLHDWSQTEEVPAVVGSFPAPFLSGLEGRRPPVRVECAPGEKESCAVAASRLRAAGVSFASTALHAGGQVSKALRLLVGTWSQLRRDTGAQPLERGPSASGVYARPSANGRAIALLDARGRVTRTLTAGSGLIAATGSTGEDPEWLITGTDAAGVRLAAQDLSEATLHDRFAVALAAGQGARAAVVLPLPRPSP